MSVKTTSMTSTRASHIEDIFDENLLREMWMEASDNESKRQIRSRMYKLREERLKDFYNREAILETILKTDDPSLSVPCQDETATSTAALVEDEAGLVTHETSLQTQATLKHGLKVTSEFSSSVAGVKRGITSVTTKNRRLLGSGDSPPPVVKETQVRNNKTVISVIKSSSRRTDSQVQKRTTQHQQSASTQKSSSSQNTNFNSYQGETKVGRSALTVTKMSTSPFPTKKVIKGMLSPKTAHRVASVTPDQPSKGLPRFMSSTKSRDIGLEAFPPSGARVPVSKKDSSPLRSLSPDVKVSNLNGSTRKKSAVNGSATPVEKKRTSSTEDHRKQNLEGQMLRSSENSRYPALRSTGKQTEVNGIPKKLRQVSPRNSVVSATKIKDKTEESIIRELDNLDSFLLQTSESPDGKGKDSKSAIVGSPETAKQKRSHSVQNTNGKQESKVVKPRPVAKVLGNEPGLIDVMEAGLEPVATRTTYKYGCTEPEYPMKEKSLLEDEIQVNEDSKPPKRESFMSQSPKSRRSHSNEGTIKSIQTSHSTRSVNSSKGVFEATVISGRVETPVHPIGAKTEAKQNITQPATKQSKPEAKQDLEQSCEPTSVHRIVKKAGVNYMDRSNEDEDPRVPPKRFGGSSKGLESPGAVQLAKSLFESKAAEAAKDRSSADFQHRGSGFSINKQSVLFDARERSETNLDVYSQPYVAPESILERTQLHDSYTLDNSDAPPHSVSNVNSATNLQARSAQETSITGSAKNTRIANKESVNQRNPKSRNTSPKSPNRNTGRVSSNNTRTNSVLEARVDAFVNQNTKVSHSLRVANFWRKSDQSDLGQIDDIKHLNRLLETAVDYEERLAIRTRIRCLARATNRTDSSIEKSTVPAAVLQKKTSTVSAELPAPTEPAVYTEKVRCTNMVNEDAPMSYKSRKPSKEIPKFSRSMESESKSKGTLKSNESGFLGSEQDELFNKFSVNKRTESVQEAINAAELPERTKSSPTKKSVKAVAQKFETVASKYETKESKSSTQAPTRSTVKDQMKKFQLNLNQTNEERAPNMESLDDRVNTNTPNTRESTTPVGKSSEILKEVESEVSRRTSKDRCSPERESKTENVGKAHSASNGLYSTRKTSKDDRKTDDSEELELLPSMYTSKMCEKKLALSKEASELEIDSTRVADIKSEPKKAYSRRTSSSGSISKTKPSVPSMEPSNAELVGSKEQKSVKSRRSSTPTVSMPSEGKEHQAVPRVDEPHSPKSKGARKSAVVNSPKGAVELKREGCKLAATDIPCSKTMEALNIHPMKADEFLDASPKMVTRSAHSSKTKHDSSTVVLEEINANQESNSVEDSAVKSSSETKAKRSKNVRKSPSKELKLDDVSNKEYVRKSPSKELKLNDISKKASVKESQKGSKSTATFSHSETRSTSKRVQATQDSSREFSNQGMDAITSSYGVGPTDDDGTPLFGLKALKKIKQNQSIVCPERGNLMDDSNQSSLLDTKLNDESEQGRRSSLRVNDNYGLRALRKNSGTITTMFTSSFPDSLDQKSETSAACLPVTTEERPPLATSPKSILKKTSSFSSNKSGSRNEVDPFGANDEKINLTLTTTTRTELTTSMPHLSQEQDYQAWKKDASEFPTCSIPVGRGHVGGSSVREMSRKFDTPEAGSSANIVATRTTISSIRSNYESDGSEDFGTVAMVPAGSGRSFLNDRTPVTGVADVMDRMRWSQSTDEETEGRSLLNKFLGAQVLMQGIEPMLQQEDKGRTSGSVTMSRSLLIKGIDIDEEQDSGKLRELLEDCDLADDKGRIETRLKTLGASGMSVSKTSSRSADVTGELMPFILGQLQNSLENIGALGSGGGSRGSSEPGHSAHKTSSTLHSGPPAEEGSVGRGSSGKPSGTQSSQSQPGTSSSSNTTEESAGSAEECLFDSGTESGDDGPSAVTKKKSPPPAEFSSFMEGLRHSLTRDGLDLREALAIPATQTEPGSSGRDSDLVQQVDQVLSLLRDSLLKDPNCLVQTLKTVPDPNKGKELIALIDRLKSSLNSNSGVGGSGTEPKAPLPFMVGTEEGPSSWSDARPPDLIQAVGTIKATHPWALRIKPLTASGTLERRDSAPTWPPVAQTPTEEVPWKIRAVKKRATRSRSIGVSEEELAEARRFLEEEAFRSALKGNQAQPPRPAPSASIKPFTPLTVGQTGRPEKDKPLNSVPRPYVRAESLMESVDNSALHQMRLKPFRTFSLDNPQDPSRTFFTPEEVVQIAVHKAAIKKQMSDEEERRGRRNSLSADLLKGMAPVSLMSRDLSVGLPKPYSAPSLVSVPSSSMSSSDESRQTVRLRSSNSADQLMLYPSPSGTGVVSTATAALPSPQRIDNVQISLKELNSSSDFPQLQIAITLNTNNQSGSSSSLDKSSGLKKVQGEDGVMPTKSGSSEDTDRSSSSKVNRYKSKSERKKKMKRANTIDLPQQAQDDPEGDDEQESDGSGTQTQTAKNVEPSGKWEAFMAKSAGSGKAGPPPSAYLHVNDKFWNSRFSNLKTSFESSSQGSSPSVSPIPLSPGKPRPAFVELKNQTKEGLHKPVWAQAAPETSDLLPSSVRNKLSVFESKASVHQASDAVSQKTSISDMWSPQRTESGNHPIQPARPFHSSILSKKESFEKKFAEESQPTVLKPKPIQTKAFAGQIEQRAPAPPLLPKKQAQAFEGVHMVHATKSALEAMQKPSFIPAPHVPPRPLPPRLAPPLADSLPCVKPEEAARPQSRVPQGLTSGVRVSKALFEAKKIPSTSPPPPIPPRISTTCFGEEASPFITSKRNEFESFQKFRGQPPLERPAPRNVGVAQPSPRPKLSVFGVAHSFDETFKQQLEATAPRVHFGSNTAVCKPEGILSGTTSAFARQVSNSAPSSRRHSENEDEPSNVMSPVMSKVMRGPQQQRATVTRREISSVGEDHPSAHRIRSATGANSNQVASFDTHFPSPPQFSGFPPQPRNLQLPAQGIVKSHSGDSLFPSQALKERQLHQQLHIASQTFNRPSPPIPRQKSMSDFPQEAPRPIPAACQALGSSTALSVSSIPVVSPNSEKKYPKTFLPSNENLKRTASGSSIFDRAKSLFISTQDAAGLRPQPPHQRRVPPALPRSSGLFPKQFEAQMSPESVGKKMRAVESYFKFPGQTTPESTGDGRSRYGRAGRKDANYQNKIRKSASQGTIVSRQRSFSDQDEDEEDVDSIFESLFKASGEPSSLSARSDSYHLVQLMESKSKQAIPGGSMTSAEKLVASQKESKQVDQSVKTSATGTSASMSMQKSSKSSSSFSSSSTASSSTIQSSGSAFSKFKQLDDQNSKKSDVGGKPLFKFTNPAIKASANSAKDMLLYWAQCRTREYQNVNLENFSSSWSDGMAFCALIHNFFPDAFDYHKLDPKNRRYNFDLAFKTADEKAGIYPLLDTEDMIAMGRRPDWKCVFTYVQSIYQKLKDL